MTAAVSILIAILPAFLTEFGEEKARQAVVKTIGGEMHRGAVIAWNSDGDLLLADQEGRRLRIPSAGVDRVTFVNVQTRAPADKWLIETADGSLLFGDIGAGDEKTVLIRHQHLGDFPVDLEDLALIQHPRSSPTLAALETEDSIRFQNGDLATGVVTHIGAEAVTIFANDQDQTLPWSVIDAIRFASADRPVDASSGILLKFIDTGRVTVTSLDWRGSTVRATLANGRSIQFDGEFLAFAEIRAGRRTWLADLPVRRFESIPFLTRSWHYRRNKNIVGGPLRIAGVDYPGGFGLHAACRLTWQLDGSYDRLTGLVGIDDSGGHWSDADVIISLDGQVAAEYRGLRHLEQPRRIDLDVRRKTLLVIEVGFGRDGDVQDRVNVINPALIRPTQAPPDSPPDR